MSSDKQHTLPNCSHEPAYCICDKDREVQCAVNAERERWTTAARKHAGTWMLFATPEAKVLADDYLMWAASMQPADEDGMRAFSLTALNPGDER